MPRCGGTKECPLEDSMTLEELKTEECVSFESNDEEEESLCTSCENVIQIRNTNKKVFDENPIRKLFGKDNATRTQTAKMRELLQVKCKIKSEEPVITKLTPIYSIDILKVRKNIKTIISKLSAIDFQNYKNYLDMLLFILESVNKWNKAIENLIIDDEEGLKFIMKGDILNIITELKIKNIGFSHEPRQAILGVQNFIQKMSQSEISKIKMALHLLATQTACFEGVLGISENILYK